MRSMCPTPTDREGMEILQYPMVAFAPGLFWLWFLRRKDDLDPEPLWLVLLVFVAGCAVALGVRSLRPELQVWLDEVPTRWRPWTDAFVVTALVEELAKLLPLLLVLRTRWFDEPLDGVIYGTAIGLGFASLENLWYLQMTGENSIAVQRGFTAVLAHVAFTGSAGFFLGIARFSSRGKGLLLLTMGLSFATLFHGLYDYLLLFGGRTSSLLSLLALLPLLLVLLAWKIQWARKRSPIFHPDKVAKER